MSSNGMPEVPAGTGRHPIPVVAISARDLASATRFYTTLFGWKAMPVSAELSAMTTPAGPSVALVVPAAEGEPGTVPFIRVPDVDAALARVTAAGGSVVQPARQVPPVGSFARFRDASGTVYGLTDAAGASPLARMPMPFGSNPKPPAGAVCSLEMYAADGDAAARFFGDQFGWGTRPTMPQFVGFDPGAGVPGVFQSHTPSLPAVAYLFVTDVHAKIAELETMGGKRTGDPMSMPGFGTFGYFTDPNGTSVGLIGP